MSIRSRRPGQMQMNDVAAITPPAGARALLGRELTAAEERLCNQRGGWPLQEVAGNDDGLDPSTTDGWEGRHEIAADLITALLQGNVVVTPNLSGLHLRGARVTGELSLADTTLGCPLIFQYCRFENPLDITGSEVRRIDLTGSWLPSLMAHGIRAHGDVVLDLCELGSVVLTSATCDGDVSLIGAHVTGPIQADALDARAISCTRDDDRRFQADDKVSFVDAKLVQLDCSNGEFGGRPISITLDGAKIEGNASFATTPAEGRSSGEGGATGFHAAGFVRAIDARAGMFDCDGAILDKGLIAERLILTGNLYLQEATIPELWLTETRIGRLVDSPASWPHAGRLHVDGFVYSGFGDTREPHDEDGSAEASTVDTRSASPEAVTAAVTDAESRLKWLSLQWPFAAQPYVHLANVYTKLGDEKSARKVNIAREWRQLRHGQLDLLHSAWRFVLGVTLGFGYSPRRAVAILLSIWIAGVLALAIHPAAEGGIVQARPPSGKTPVSAAVDDCPSEYPCFSRWAYSWDTVVPLVRLGQIDHWRPDGSQEGRRVQAIGNVMTAMGWLVATLAAAGLTGVVRRT